LKQEFHFFRCWHALQLEPNYFVSYSHFGHSRMTGHANGRSDFQVSLSGSHQVYVKEVRAFWKDGRRNLHPNQSV
jgi:hypothetical protein